MRVRSIIFTTFILVPIAQGLTSQSSKSIRSAEFSRRESLHSIIAFSATLSSLLSPNTVHAEEDVADKFAYELRNRNKNKDALVRDDIWYFSGSQPPRKFDPSNLPPGPKWNAWGTCTSDSSTGNSCTYVSLKQKIPAYSKSAFTISLGAREYTELGDRLKAIKTSSNPASANDISEMLQIVDPGKEKSFPSPAVDAQLKMVLLSTSLLTSPNYTGPPFELLIARFYVNEVNFSTKEISDALNKMDIERAYRAWEFGKDSWNSYFIIVNKAIVPKVGDKFELIV